MLERGQISESDGMSRSGRRQTPAEWASSSVSPMRRVLVLADEPWIRNEVHAALTAGDLVLIDHDDPTTVVDAIIEHEVDAVVADMQVGSMGGMAVVRRIRAASSIEDLEEVPVILLLDRSADAFLARRAAAAGWVQKPFTSREIATVLDAAIGTAPTNDDELHAIPAEEIGSELLPEDTEPEPAA